MKLDNLLDILILQGNWTLLLELFTTKFTFLIFKLGVFLSFFLNSLNFLGRHLKDVRFTRFITVVSGFFESNIYFKRCILLSDLVWLIILTLFGIFSLHTWFMTGVVFTPGLLRFLSYFHLLYFVLCRCWLGGINAYLFQRNEYRAGRGEIHFYTYHTLLTDVCHRTGNRQLCPFWNNFLLRDLTLDILGKLLLFSVLSLLFDLPVYLALSFLFPGCNC